MMTPVEEISRWSRGQQQLSHLLESYNLPLEEGACYTCCNARIQNLGPSYSTLVSDVIDRCIDSCRQNSSPKKPNSHYDIVLFQLADQIAEPCTDSIASHMDLEDDGFTRRLRFLEVIDLNATENTTTSPTLSPTLSSSSNNRSRNGLIIVVVIALAMLSCFAFVILFRPKKDKVDVNARLTSLASRESTPREVAAAMIGKPPNSAKKKKRNLNFFSLKVAPKEIRYDGLEVPNFHNPDDSNGGPIIQRHGKGTMESEFEVDPAEFDGSTDIDEVEQGTRAPQSKLANKNEKSMATIPRELRLRQPETSRQAMAPANIRDSAVSGIKSEIVESELGLEALETGSRHSQKTWTSRASQYYRKLVNRASRISIFRPSPEYIDSRNANFGKEIVYVNTPVPQQQIYSSQKAKSQGDILRDTAATGMTEVNDLGLDARPTRNSSTWSSPSNPSPMHIQSSSREEGGDDDLNELETQTQSEHDFESVPPSVLATQKSQYFHKPKYQARVQSLSFKEEDIRDAAKKLDTRTPIITGGAADDEGSTNKNNLRPSQQIDARVSKQIRETAASAGPRATGFSLFSGFSFLTPPNRKDFEEYEVAMHDQGKPAPGGRIVSDRITGISGFTMTTTTRNSGKLPPKNSKSHLSRKRHVSKGVMSRDSDLNVNMRETDIVTGLDILPKGISDDNIFSNKQKPVVTNVNKPKNLRAIQQGKNDSPKLAMINIGSANLPVNISTPGSPSNATLTSTLVRSNADIDLSLSHISDSDRDSIVVKKTSSRNGSQAQYPDYNDEEALPDNPSHGRNIRPRLLEDLERGINKTREQTDTSRLDTALEEFGSISL